jgi:hypothetical protein
MVTNNTMENFEENYTLLEEQVVSLRIALAESKIDSNTEGIINEIVARIGSLSSYATSLQREISEESKK